MANKTVTLNNYSDDSQIKKFMAEELAPRVFHDIPLSVLNTGFFSLVSEYISQITEQLGFTSSFYFNEAFITKAVLPDSIYAEAAIFNIGYSFATPASTNFLFELKIDDIYKNAKFNPDNGLYEFILDKNTKINLPEGFVYSFDYDILVQYKNVETSNYEAAHPTWNVQYINREDANMCATNKNIYITYRVTETWLCMLIQANEYERETHKIVNNTSNGVPNQDTVITCNNHIAGFDIKYTDINGNSKWLTRDHILAIHDTVKDNEPYVHYIMDNPQTIRLMWQLSGNRYFVPEANSSFEITIYTCHGKAANAPDYKNDQQPNVVTTSNRFNNNGNVLKAAFVVSGCYGGADIGTVETVRRETIEAYNTANVISTDHDIEEWFKTFYFKNILYPFFFKRRDDPWGRIWSGFIALTDNDNYVYRTNTLHATIPYEVLYNNSKNTISNNEIIIPPGWVWTYTTDEDRRFKVTPYTKGNGVTVETVKTLASISDKFVFSNPFGIRIQKQPFAIGYFNPWTDQFVLATRETTPKTNGVGNVTSDMSVICHANHLVTYISRTYASDCYTVITHILPTMDTYNDQNLVDYFRVNATTPTFVDTMWNYFKQPLDLYGGSIPVLPLKESDGFIPFDPDRTFLCVKYENRNKDSETNTWRLSELWIEDETTSTTKVIDLSITGQSMYIYGSDAIWGDGSKVLEDNKVLVSDKSEIDIWNMTRGETRLDDNDPITFTRDLTHNYYEMRFNSKKGGNLIKMVVTEAYETDLTKYGKDALYRIGRLYQNDIYINLFYRYIDEDGMITEQQTCYRINNAASILTPIKWNENTSTPDSYEFDLENVLSNEIILYADMKPSPDSGSVDYYRIPFSAIQSKEALFYIHSEQFPIYKNNMRVIMHTYANGSETGRVEMQPVSRESDGSYTFAATMYPLTELIDIDNRINIASINNGGGDWKPVNTDTVFLDALDPQIKISILIRSDDKNKDSDIEIGDEYTGYRLMDRYKLDDVDLVQELKEMRSVVKFGDSSIPTAEQMKLYKLMIKLVSEDPSEPYNINYMIKYSYDRMHGFTSTFAVDGDIDPNTFAFFKEVAGSMKSMLSNYISYYIHIMNSEIPDWYNEIDEVFDSIINDEDENGNDLDWEYIYNVLFSYQSNVNTSFEHIEVNGGVEIQLVPFVEYTLMTSDRFRRFIASFTQIHKAIEPVIFKRLEGNNYLDCKLLATYGLPHSYSSDVDAEREGVFWPDLNVQIEFDVKLYNLALTTNTIDELRNIVKSYFNRITTVHTPLDAISMDNNIYISHVIQQMEAHDNVAYMKFKGWYTNEKGKVNGNYMNAEYQAIEQKWKKLEDMPTDELERFVPEMFVLDDDNIVINIIK